MTIRDDIPSSFTAVPEIQTDDLGVVAVYPSFVSTETEVLLRSILYWDQFTSNNVEVKLKLGLVYNGSKKN